MREAVPSSLRSLISARQEQWGPHPPDAGALRVPQVSDNRLSPAQLGLTGRRSFLYVGCIVTLVSPPGRQWVMRMRHCVTE